MAGKIQIALDPTQQRLFVNFFNSLPEKPPTTIRFFNRIEYFTVHGSDAVFAAKEVFRTTSFLKVIGSGKEVLDTLILNKSQFENFVRDLLLVKQYRVEVYSNKGNKQQNSWTLEYKGSPGNLSQFEELLFSNIDQVEGNAVLSIKYDSKTKSVGVALIDTVDHTFSVVEFSDDDHFSNFESVIIQFGPKECVVPNESSPEIDNIKKVVERCGIMLTLRKKADFTTDNVVQDLNHLVKFKEGQQQNANAIPQVSLVLAMSALAASVKYLELNADKDNFNTFSVNTLDHGRFVHLDCAAINALNIVNQTESSSAQNATRSLLSLLDVCRTTHGHRLLQRWIRQPLKDINVVNDRHDVVELFLKETLLRQSLYDEHLRKFPDLQVLAKKLMRKKASMQDCYRIYQAIERIPTLLGVLEEYTTAESHPTLRDMIVTPLKDLFEDMAKYQEMVVTTMDLSMVDKGEFLIKPDFDENLQGLRDKMDDLEEGLKKELGKAARDLSLEANKTLKLDSNSQYGYFFRISLKEEQAIRNSKEYAQLDCNKAGVRFRNKKLTHLNEEFLETRNEYLEHQQSVVMEVVNIAVGYSTTLHAISGVLAQLDVLCSFAVVAAGAPKPYVRPVMKPKGSGKLQLTKVRHPCLELMDTVSFIANDVNFDKNDALFYIITGPNMGGKSTYIRSVGVTALLAHIGSLVPCDSAEIPILDAILARVGANDSQIKGMSTFMVEMVETASILKAATSDSLVIIDELGRGTSTYEGCGIAWAISEYLAKETKAFTLFASHFHELTRLADEIDAVKNLHVTAVTSEDGLTLLYEIEEGACDQSFGIHVAKMAKFPNHVIEDAKRKLVELEDYQSSIEAESDVKKRKIIIEGETLIKETLKTCKGFDLESMSDEDLQIKLAELREELKKSGNPYIELLLTNMPCLST